MIPVSTLLGGVAFVALAAVSVLTMFEASRPARAPQTRSRLLVAHRVAGYLFVIVLLVMVWTMLPRLAGTDSSELPSSIVVHVTCVLALVPMLVSKITIARRYKHSHSLLAPLGLAILTISFVIVAVPAVPTILRSLRPESFATGTGLSVGALWIVFIGCLAIWRPKRAPMTGTSLDPNPRMLEVPTKPASTTLLLSSVKRETHDTITLRFTIQGGKALSARPGQFMTFHWTIQGKRVPRSYTISSSPSQAGYLEITPKRVKDGLVSQFLHDEAGPGLTVEATGPHGTFYFDRSAHQNIVLIAGGVGITPMISMLRHIETLRLPTIVTLLYCVRTSKDIVFEAELERLRSSPIQFNYAVVLSQPEDGWRGHRGRLTRELILAHVADLNASTFFLCGPQGFMDTARELLESLAVDQIRIRQESFGSRPSSATQSFTKSQGIIEFVRAHKICDSPTGSTLLEVAEANGVSIPFSCRQGQCGTCAMRVLQGSVHSEANDGLTREQIDQGFVLPCVSRAEGTVILEV